jgi:hypothetical protein
MKKSMMMRRMIPVAVLTLTLGAVAVSAQQEAAAAPITEQDLLGGL